MVSPQSQRQEIADREIDVQVALEWLRDETYMSIDYAATVESTEGEEIEDNF